MDAQASSVLSSLLSLVRSRRKSFGSDSFQVLIAVTIFLSAFLLFQVQPIAARYILPWFGGGPAVWTSCLLFFQTGLLGGYLFAHWMISGAAARRAGVVQIALLALSLAALPIRPNATLWKSP
ncbi:MAG TPA: hypothetical protein VKG79_12465, partial [Bryobacteraceae bacterium]|nr:hypothetical protein [Bryobacteraceae bacterium]